MKLEVVPKHFNNYCLRLGDFIEDDEEIIKLLDLSKDEYIKIMKKHHAKNVLDFSVCYYFENREDAEKAVEELSPYVVMLTLMGE